MIAELDDAYIRASRKKSLIRLSCEIFFEGRPLTSRWRWLNPLTIAFLKSASRIPFGRKDSKPIFIVGSGRSGTTLLGKIISLHPDVGFLNEPKLMWYLANPEDDLIGSYSKTDGRYRLEGRDASARVRERIDGMYTAFLGLTQTRRIADKYPEMVFRIPYLLALYPDARIILVLRNGWDTTRSITRWSNVHGNQDKGLSEDWWGRNSRKYRLLVDQVVSQDPDLADISQAAGTFSQQPDRAAVEWMATYLAGIREFKRNPASIQILRYEDLIQDPMGSISKIFSFCDMPPSDIPLNYATKILYDHPGQKELPLHPAIEETFRTMISEAGYD